MNRQNRLTTSRRQLIFTRKQQLADLAGRKNNELADQIARQLEPFIKAEIARQLEDALEERRS